MDTIAAPRERAFAAAENPIDSLGLQFVRASGLAQARLQLAILSGNRGRALCEIDRLVEIDRQLARLIESGDGACAEICGDELATHLARQRGAIATEKLVLGAAIEFPRVPAARREHGELLLGQEHEVAVIEDEGFSHRLSRMLFGLIAAIAVASLLAIAVPILIGGWALAR